MIFLRATSPFPLLPPPSPPPPSAVPSPPLLPPPPPPPFPTLVPASQCRLCWIKRISQPHKPRGTMRDILLFKIFISAGLASDPINLGDLQTINNYKPHVALRWSKWNEGRGCMGMRGGGLWVLFHALCLQVFDSFFSFSFFRSFLSFSLLSYDFPFFINSLFLILLPSL